MPKSGGTENTDLKVDGQADPDPDHQRSHLAEELQELKSTILRVASERERLPQPLFWSLFRTRIDAIRKAKEVERVIAEELNGGG
jgi:hypothetical protein